MTHDICSGCFKTGPPTEKLRSSFQTFPPSWRQEPTCTHVSPVFRLCETQQSPNTAPADQSPLRCYPFSLQAGEILGVLFASPRKAFGGAHVRASIKMRRWVALSKHTSMALSYHKMSMNSEERRKRGEGTQYMT